MLKRKSIFLDVFLVGTLLLTSLWLRLSTLKFKFFDIDEAFELYFSAKPTIKEMFSSVYACAPQQFPLNYLVDFVATRFTTHIDTLRRVPLILGIGSVISLYFLGKILHSRTFGWIWAWLLSTSIIHIEYSQSLRQYSLVLFLSILSLIFFFQFLERKGSVIPYIVTMFLFQGAYQFAFVFGLIEMGYAYFYERKKFKVVLSSIGFIFIIPIIWLAFQHQKLFQSRLFNFSSNLVFSGESLFRFIQNFGQKNTSIAIGYFLLALIGMSFVTGRSQNNRKYLIFGTILFWGTLAIIFMALIKAHLFFEARHAMALLPIYLGFVSVTLVAIVQFITAKGKGSLIIKKILLIAFITFSILMGTFNSLKEYVFMNLMTQKTLRDSVGFLRSEIQLNDTVVFCNPNFGATFIYFYDPSSFFQLNRIGVSQGFNLFEFPKDLQLHCGIQNNRAFTLCSVSSHFATIDRERFQSLRKESRQRGAKVWLVYQRPNYYFENNPFYNAFGLSSGDLSEPCPGVFFLK